MDSVLRTDCLIGAMQDWFWGASGADRALGFCALISDASQKGARYLSLILFSGLQLTPNSSELISHVFDISP